jgi:hypothetical protein
LSSPHHSHCSNASGRTRRVEFEYRRGGTLAYFAAHDVHLAQVLGQIAATTGIEPFTDLVAHVMTTEPYASAQRVFWVVDNGSSHNGQRSIKRMQTAWPTATLVHLPVHASWLNQVEIYFSILQRKAISPNDFADLDQLAEHIIGFQDRYNTTATPFDWTYTRDDLNAFPPPRPPRHTACSSTRRITPDELTTMTTRWSLILPGQRDGSVPQPLPSDPKIRW